MEESSDNPPPPEVIAWFFHDSPAHLDDPEAPLPTSSSKTTSDLKSSYKNSSDAENSEDRTFVDNAAAFKKAETKVKQLEKEQENRSNSSPPPHGPVFTITSYVGSISPNLKWNAFSKYDNHNLEVAYQSKESRSQEVVVGLNRLYAVQDGLLNPLYWSPLGPPANVVRSTWFFCSSLTPVSPSLEEELVRAYHQIRPWELVYVSELISSVDIPEALDKIRVPISFNSEGKKMQASVVFAPCQHVSKNKANKQHNMPETFTKTMEESIKSSEASLSENSKANIPDLHPMSYPVAYILNPGTSSISIPLLGNNAKSQLASQLLSGKTPTSTLLSVQMHFSWDEWKKIKDLADRPIDADDYQPQKISQLILVFHGIGQKLTERMESFNFTYAINTFRILVMDQLNQSYVSNLVDNSKGIAVLPVNWRRTVDFNQLNSQSSSNFSLQDITMKSIPTVRNLISDVMLDIPYYMSHHKPLLLDAAAKEANRIYNLFIKYNPGFEDYGTVNIIGHSLGSIIAVDLLTNQPTDINNCSPEDTTKKFNFNTSNLFLVGSPVAFFLLLENASLRPRALFEHEMVNLKSFFSSPFKNYSSKVQDKRPYGCVAVDNIYNILHYSDPISYLLNPTVDSSLAKSIEPPNIPTERAFNVVNSETISFLDHITSKFPTIPFLGENTTSASERTSSRSTPSRSRESSEVRERRGRSPHFKSLHKSSNNPSPSFSPNRSSNRIEVQGSVGTSQFMESDSSFGVADQNPSSLDVELDERDFKHENELTEKLYMLNDNGQIDWIIPLSGTLENQYLSMLTAHSGYWDNKDFARMVAIECARPRGKNHTIFQYRAPKKK